MPKKSTRIWLLMCGFLFYGSWPNRCSVNTHAILLALLLTTSNRLWRRTLSHTVKALLCSLPVPQSMKGTVFNINAYLIYLRLEILNLYFINQNRGNGLEPKPFHIISCFFPTYSDLKMLKSNSMQFHGTNEPWIVQPVYAASLL